jgi:type I restriction enzyme S subunit
MSKSEAGMIGSHRFPCFRADEARLDSRFLLSYFKTPTGLDLLGRISPGGAGRNRTLSRKAFLEQSIPLPSLAEQRRLVARIEELSAQIHEARNLRKEAAAEAEILISRTNTALLDDRNWEKSELGDVLIEKPRNGIGPQEEVESNGRALLRINAVSSSPTRFVDMSATKHVRVTDEAARPFLLQHDDVFIVRYNGDINRVAKPAIYKGANEGKALYPDKLIRLRVDQKVMIPDFLVFALGARSVREQVEELGKTTAGNIGVSGANARSFIIPVPTLPEQRRIVAELDAMQAEVDVLKRLQAETSAELEALLPSILDRAFSGML